MNYLSSPLATEGFSLHNRLVMPPMSTSRASETGKVTPEVVAYYDERTQGSCIGLVIVEHSFVSKNGKANRGQLSVARDEDIAGLKDLVRTVHKNGSKVMLQINHAGGAAESKVTGSPALGPSKTPMPWTKVEPCEMSEEDIERAVEAFAAAALRAKRAGFDGVEIHAAHGYLLNQFYSPLTNKRTDAYRADSIERRLKLHLAVIDAVRMRVGAEYPLALRLGTCDYQKGGTTLEDSIKAARILERKGIDLLDVSGGVNGYSHPDTKKPGYFAELSAPIRQAVGMPVLVTGGIMRASEAELLLKTGAADLVGVGRALLRDPDWARRAMASYASGD